MNKKMRVWIQFFILTSSLISFCSIAQTGAKPAPLKRYQGLSQCQTSAGGLSASDTHLISPASLLSNTDTTQFQRYRKFNSVKETRVIGKVGSPKLKQERLDELVTLPDQKRIKFARDYIQQKLGGVLSVGAGGDFQGGSFLGGKRVFISRNLKGESCWTYVSQNTGDEQVFDYDGFEEIAAIFENSKAKCSAVIIGQSYALTARHCASQGVMLIPTKPSRTSKNNTVRKSEGCSFQNQYMPDCEYEVVKYEDVSSFAAASTKTVQFNFKSPFDGINRTFDVLGSADGGSPDIRLIEFNRKESSKARQPYLLTAKLSSYSVSLAKIDDVFPFVRAGYGYSFEPATPSLTIGSWSSVSLPVKVSEQLVFDNEYLYAYVALFHSKEQKSRICKGDSGGALFSGIPNGRETSDKGNGSRTLVGIISAAKQHGSATNCLESPAEVSHVINNFYLKRLCEVTKSELNGC